MHEKIEKLVKDILHYKNEFYMKDLIRDLNVEYSHSLAIYLGKIIKQLGYRRKQDKYGNWHYIKGSKLNDVEILILQANENKINT